GRDGRTPCAPTIPWRPSPVPCSLPRGLNHAMRNNTNRAMLAFVVALFVVAVYIVWPNDPKKYLPGFIPWPSGSGLHLSGFKREQMRLGLDLKGGARTVVQ